MEGETPDIKPIAAGAGVIVGKRYLIQMRSQDRVERMKRDRRERKKIDGLSGIISRVLENTIPRRLSQYNAVTRTRVSLDKPFVREEKECLVLPVPKMSAALTWPGDHHWTPNIKTIEVLSKDRLWLAVKIVEEQIGVGPRIVHLKEGPTMKFV